MRRWLEKLDRVSGSVRSLSYMLPAALLACGDAPTNPDLALARSMRITLPVEVRPEQVATSKNGAVAVLSPETRRVALVRDQRITLLSLPDSGSPVGLRFAEDVPHALEILDRRRGVIDRTRPERWFHGSHLPGRSV